MLKQELIKYLNGNTLIGIKGGRDRERFTDIWMVNIDDRFFSRSWNRNTKSWFIELVKQGNGQIQFGSKTVNVKGQKVDEGDKIQNKINAAYLIKYNQPENIVYSEGITKPEYSKYTLEFILLE
ncbi:MAG: DUF2255 family protein [Bacteroidia bacterium]